MRRLTLEALHQGFGRFKDEGRLQRLSESDLPRGKVVHSVIDDHPNLFKGRGPPSHSSIEGKNAGPTRDASMIDANQVWDVPQATEHVKEFAGIKPWFIKEPTAPDMYVRPLYLSAGFVPFLPPTAIAPHDLRVVNSPLGRACIRPERKPCGIGVATGKRAHNRTVFEQLLQAGAIDVAPIDSCRLAGVSEGPAVLLMAAKFGKPICPHIGGVGLREMSFT